MVNHKNKSEEMREWVASLKPGDKVIYKTYRTICPLSVLTVRKVTPTGIVRTTNDISFTQNSWGGSVRGCGNTKGEIVPATPDLLAEVKKQKVIRDAKNFANDVGCGKIDVTYEFAVEFLELLERHKKEDLNAQ